MLQKHQRLTHSRDFKRVFSGGRTFVHKLLVLKVLSTTIEEPGKFGFSTSVKLGNAIVRNRAKRQLRESVRLLNDSLKQFGYNAVIIARPPIKSCSFIDLSQAVAEMLKKAGLIVISDQKCSNTSE